MFGPSLKSVPGCLVSMVPMLIGDPVAATPGFVPHDEMLTPEALLLPPAPELDELAALLAEALGLLLLLLLPHPASASSASMATNARSPRDRGTTCGMLTALLSSEGVWPCLEIRSKLRA
jgi:MFS superfamily sulfate permease-like transporter